MTWFIVIFISNMTFSLNWKVYRNVILKITLWLYLFYLTISCFSPYSEVQIPYHERAVSEKPKLLCDSELYCFFVSISQCFIVNRLRMALTKILSKQTEGQIVAASCASVWLVITAVTYPFSETGHGRHGRPGLLAALAAGSDSKFDSVPAAIPLPAMEDAFVWARTVKRGKGKAR